MRLSCFTLLISMIALTACQHDNAKKTANDQKNIPFHLQTEINPALEYENLRLLPVSAAPSFINQNKALADYQSLGEAMENDRFRIVEKKPYGRFSDASAVNTLTVMNKSDQSVILMAGDIVQGGNQDRVIAEDMLVPPATITDISVFCVEKGRWTPRQDGLQESHSKNKRAIAFSGYYNVASSDIRSTVKHSKNQQEVWKKVGELTSLHNAKAETETYAGLENSNTFTSQRNNYLQFFSDKMENEQVVGMVAVSGNKVIGTDIFGHPTLFRKQYKALLHGYITQAISNGSLPAMSEEALEDYEQRLLIVYEAAENNSEQRYEINGKMIHFTELPK